MGKVEQRRLRFDKSFRPKIFDGRVDDNEDGIETYPFLVAPRGGGIVRLPIPDDYTEGDTTEGVLVTKPTWLTKVHAVYGEDFDTMKLGIGYFIHSKTTAGDLRRGWEDESVHSKDMRGGLVPIEYVCCVVMSVSYIIL